MRVLETSNPPLAGCSLATLTTSSLCSLELSYVWLWMPIREPCYMMSMLATYGYRYCTLGESCETKASQSLAVLVHPHSQHNYYLIHP